MNFPAFNVVGGAVAVIALGAILYFGASSACDPTMPAPQTLDTPAAPAPEVPVSKPHRIVPRRAMPDVNKVCTVAHPCHTVVKKNGAYHKILKGGKVDGATKCSWVPAVAREYPKDQVLAAAKQYGISEKKLAALSVCLN